jgi:hypothetical protein
MYMASGSGIPEIKTILSGFVIPNFLDAKVLVVKAIGAIFAVATGMCLGKVNVPSLSMEHVLIAPINVLGRSVRAHLNLRWLASCEAVFKVS